MFQQPFLNRLNVRAGLPVTADMRLIFHIKSKHNSDYQVTSTVVFFSGWGTEILPLKRAFDVFWLSVQLFIMICSRRGFFSGDAGIRDKGGNVCSFLAYQQRQTSFYFYFLHLSGEKRVKCFCGCVFSCAVSNNRIPGDDHVKTSSAGVGAQTTANITASKH